MNEKEFRKLKRSELVELVYQLELDLEILQQENEHLQQELNEKKSEIKNLMSLEQAIERLNRMGYVEESPEPEKLMENGDSTVVDKGSEEDRLEQMLKQKADRFEKAIQQMEENHKAEWQRIKDEQQNHSYREMQ